MPATSTPRLLWRDVSVFDGLQELPEPMAVLVEDGRVALHASEGLLFDATDEWPQALEATDPARILLAWLWRR